MIQPGRETNIPTSSGHVNGRAGMTGTPLLRIDGFTLTLGLVMLMILALLIWQTFFTKRRR